MGVPKNSVVTEKRAADCRESELVPVSARPSGDGALHEGSVTQTMENGATRSPLQD